MCSRPVIDVRIQKSLFSNIDFCKNLTSVIWENGKFAPSLSVFDTILVFNTTVYTRDGQAVRRSLSRIGFLMQIPFHTAYLCAFTQLLPVKYCKSYVPLEKESIIKKEAAVTAKNDIILAFASLFILTREYYNYIIAEISQISVGGQLRTISMKPTEGISTWQIQFQSLYQPIVVPVGRSTLGRIFNVTGSTVDKFLNLPISSSFNILFLCHQKRENCIKILQMKICSKKLYLYCYNKKVPSFFEEGAQLQDLFVYNFTHNSGFYTRNSWFGNLVLYLLFHEPLVVSFKNSIFCSFVKSYRHSFNLNIISIARFMVIELPEILKEIVQHYSMSFEHLNLNLKPLHRLAVPIMSLNIFQRLYERVS